MIFIVMQVLRLGSKGDDVKRWQSFLRGALPLGSFIAIDGDFGTKTLEATIQFQQKRHITADGVVGSQTLAEAARLGYPLTHDVEMNHAGPSWPACPAGVRPLGDAEKKELFGEFSYVATPTKVSPEAIRITDGWDRKNITYVKIPQIEKATGRDIRVGIHVKVEKQFLSLWQAWEDRDLLKHVLTFNGAFNARFIRGSTTNLSNHSLGSAFDINVKWNRLGAQPALVGEEGCVRELVETAVEHGFFWGGFFHHRKDGQHFEVYKLL